MVTTPLLWDIARCTGHTCNKKESCRRYTERSTSGPSTPHFKPPIDADLTNGCALMIAVAEVQPIIATENNRYGEYVDVQLTLPNETIKILAALAKQGILGTTKEEEVALHMIKQHLFTEMQAVTKKGRA